MGIHVEVTVGLPPSDDERREIEDLRKKGYEYMGKHFRYYVLDGKEARPVEDPLEWARQMGNKDRHVATDDIGRAHVSTVFLGIDHGRYPAGTEDTEVLFETMVFGGPMDGHQVRYRTWEEAEQGHRLVVELVWDLEGTLRIGFYACAVWAAAFVGRHRTRLVKGARFVGDVLGFTVLLAVLYWIFMVAL